MVFAGAGEDAATAAPPPSLFFSLHLYSLAPHPRNREKADADTTIGGGSYGGAATGPLVGARARLWLSTPPSSGSGRCPLCPVLGESTRRCDLATSDVGDCPRGVLTTFGGGDGVPQVGTPSSSLSIPF